MKIHYLGHSCFSFADGAGTRLVTDPYGDVGFSMPAVTADAVTVSHGHYDHCNVAAVGGDPAVFDRAGRYSVHGVGLELIPRYHDDARGARRGGNLVLKFRMDGLLVCHLGDLGEPCCAETLSAIGKADVLLIPVGGHYTIDAAQAWEYVGAIAPAVVIPMHFKTAGLTVDVAGVEPFLRLCKGYPVERAGSGYELNDPPERKILVMERLK